MRYYHTILDWCTKSFFKPLLPRACRLCGSQTEDPTTGSITSEERDKAVITAHLFYCPLCGATMRIVQNLSVDGIVKTKEGRPEEAAICFSATLKGVVIDSSIVFPSISRNVVWVEYWSTADEESVHIDPFTGVHGNPLRYEADEVVSVGPYEVADVTRRYTQFWRGSWADLEN
jgi:hypothetical protein